MNLWASGAQSLQLVFLGIRESWESNARGCGQLESRRKVQQRFFYFSINHCVLWELHKKDQKKIRSFLKVHFEFALLFKKNGTLGAREMAAKNATCF